jgi:hypothetical protein
VTFEDAKYQIFQAISLELSNHHCTSFKRLDEDKSKSQEQELFIAFKLKLPVS